MTGKQTVVSMQNRDQSERPREHMLEWGAAALSDVDLLAALLGTGTRGADVLEMAGRVARAVNLRRLHLVPVEDLQAIRGLGPARTAQLLAAAELGRRLWPDGDAAPLVRGPEQIYDLTRDIRSANREHFVGFYLNSRHQVLRRDIISIGSLNASIVHPREVFLPAIAHSAASLVLAHNHPSGDPTPSEEDLAITRRLSEAGRLLGIELVDHVVVARDAYASFRERKLLGG
jgi:DNA repair protein RadC